MHIHSHDRKLEILEDTSIADAIRRSMMDETDVSETPVIDWSGHPKGLDRHWENRLKELRLKKARQRKKTKLAKIARRK